MSQWKKNINTYNIIIFTKVPLLRKKNEKIKDSADFLTGMLLKRHSHANILNMIFNIRRGGTQKKKKSFRVLLYLTERKSYVHNYLTIMTWYFLCEKYYGHCWIWRKISIQTMFSLGCNVIYGLVPLSIYLSIYHSLSIYLLIYRSFSICLVIYLSIHLTLYLPTHLSTYLSVCIYISSCA